MQSDEKLLIERFMTKDINPSNGLDLGCGPRVAINNNHDEQAFSGKLLGIDWNSPFEPDLCCNILDIDKHYRENSVKFITLIHMLEDLENPYECMRKIVKILDKEGILVVVCPYRGKYHRIGTQYANPGHSYDFEPYDVEYIIWRCFGRQKLNYEILSRDTLNNDYSFEIVIRKKTKVVVEDDLLMDSFYRS